MNFSNKGNGSKSGSIRESSCGSCGTGGGLTAADVCALLSGCTIIQDLSAATQAIDVFVSGGTADVVTQPNGNQTLTFVNTSGGTFSIVIDHFDCNDLTGCTAFQDIAECAEKGYVDVDWDGASDTLEFTNCSGGTKTVVLTGGTEIFVSGSTWLDSDTLQFTNTSGGTFDVTGLSSTDCFVTGVTHFLDADGCGVTGIINLNDPTKDVKIRWFDENWISGCTLTRLSISGGTTDGNIDEFSVTDDEYINFTSSGETVNVSIDPSTNTVNFEVDVCEPEMTRATLIALRNSSSLKKDCHYVITDPSPNGTLQAQKILLHAVDANTLSGCYIKVAHDNTAWNGSYDIDTNRVEYIHDHLRNNKVTGNAAIIIFPFGVASVSGNEVHSGAILTYNSGTVTNNTINSISRVTVNSGTFRDNTVANESTVTISTTNAVEENKITGRGTLTVTGAAAFARNNVTSQARVNTSRTCYRNDFTTYSNSILSGAGQLNDSQIADESTLTMSSTISTEHLVMRNNASLTISNASSFSSSTISEDSVVTIVAGQNYNNHVEGRSTYRQVGAGTLRHSRIDNKSSVTNGDTALINITVKNTSSINTTGASGDLSRSTFDRTTVTATNCPQLFLRDSTFEAGASVTATNAARLYFYRGSVNSAGRILLGAGARIDSNYSNISDLGYIESSVSGGFLTVNYSTVKGLSYIRNITANAHSVDRCHVSSGSRISFEGNSSGCRAYYSSATGGSSLYFTTNSQNCYMYYVTASSIGQVYFQNSRTGRIYYSNATSYSYIRSINNTNTHYLYYCNADSRGYVQTLTNGGVTRMYAVNAEARSIAELRNSRGNIYYSSFSAYFYAYITRSGGTSSGLFGQGRRSQTITNPTAIAPYSVGSAWLNF